MPRWLPFTDDARIVGVFFAIFTQHATLRSSKSICSFVRLSPNQLKRNKSAETSVKLHEIAMKLLNKNTHYGYKS